MPEGLLEDRLPRSGRGPPWQKSSTLEVSSTVWWTNSGSGPTIISSAHMSSEDDELGSYVGSFTVTLALFGLGPALRPAQSHQFPLLVEAGFARPGAPNPSLHSEMIARAQLLQKWPS
jgi:hypothetical protein